MSGYKPPDFKQRRNDAAAAKKALVEKFRTTSESPGDAERAAAPKPAGATRKAGKPRRKG